MRVKKRLVLAWPARANADHNPFQRLLSDALEEQGWIVREFTLRSALSNNEAVWHWHWPDGQFGHKSRAGALLRFLVLLLLLLKARVCKTPIIWTAHNLRGHDSPHASLEKRFMKIFRSQLSGIHYLSEASRDAAIRLFPELASKIDVITPHGHYRSVFPAPLSKVEARVSLGLEPTAPIIAFCGKVRAYKGTVDLIRSFRNVSDPNACLIIAGAATRDEEELVRSAASRDPRVKFIIKLLTDEEVSQVVGAADLIALPYREVTNSGSALLALSLNRPILASDKGSISELARTLGPKWVSTYERLDSGVIADTLKEAVRMQAQEVDLSAFDWREISVAVSALYETASIPHLGCDGRSGPSVQLAARTRGQS